MTSSEEGTGKYRAVHREGEDVVKAARDADLEMAGESTLLRVESTVDLAVASSVFLVVAVEYKNMMVFASRKARGGDLFRKLECLVDDVYQRTISEERVRDLLKAQEISGDIPGIRALVECMESELIGKMVAEIEKNSDMVSELETSGEPEFVRSSLEGMLAVDFKYRLNLERDFGSEGSALERCIQRAREKTREEEWKAGRIKTTISGVIEDMKEENENALLERARSVIGRLEDELDSEDAVADAASLMAFKEMGTISTSHRHEEGIYEFFPRAHAKPVIGFSHGFQEVEKVKSSSYLINEIAKKISPRGSPPGGRYAFEKNKREYLESCILSIYYDQ